MKGLLSFLRFIGCGVASVVLMLITRVLIRMAMVPEALIVNGEPAGVGPRAAVAAIGVVTAVLSFCVFAPSPPDPPRML